VTALNLNAVNGDASLAAGTKDPVIKTSALAGKANSSAASSFSATLNQQVATRHNRDRQDMPAAENGVRDNDRSSKRSLQTDSPFPQQQPPKSCLEKSLADEDAGRCDGDADDLSQQTPLASVAAVAESPSQLSPLLETETETASAAASAKNGDTIAINYPFTTSLSVTSALANTSASNAAPSAAESLADTKIPENLLSLSDPRLLNNSQPKTLDGVGAIPGWSSLGDQQESSLVKDNEVFNKLAANVFTGQEGGKRALNADFLQQQHSQSGSYQLDKNAQFLVPPATERPRAEQFLAAMQAAIQTQPASVDRAGNSEAEINAPDLIKNVDTMNQSLSADAKSSALINAKADTSTDFANSTVRVLAPINERLGQGPWQHDLSQRINIMLNQQIQNAVVQLHPRHLGSMEISVTLGQDQQVNVSFQVQHLHAKDALDAALPKLREMLQAQGFNLNNSDVNYRHNHDGQESRAPRRTYYSALQEADADNADIKQAQAITLLHHASGGLDLFV